MSPYSEMENLHEKEGFGGGGAVSVEPLIYEGDDEECFPLAPDGVYDTNTQRRWMAFNPPKQHLRHISHTSPRLRHSFPHTPDPLGPSPTLPLYFLESDTSQESVGFPPELFKRPSSMAWSVKQAFASTLVYYRSLPFWNSQIAWLLLYFSFNLLLTLSNKIVLIGFPFPYTLTALHALFSSVGGTWLRWRGAYTSKRLSRRNELILAGFSVLYAINIAVSNISLNLVTVPVRIRAPSAYPIDRHRAQFHQVIRAVTPIFTILLSVVFFDAHFSKRKMFSLAPVIFGVALA